MPSDMPSLLTSSKYSRVPKYTKVAISAVNHQPPATTAPPMASPIPVPNITLLSIWLFCCCGCGCLLLFFTSCCFSSLFVGMTTSPSEAFSALTSLSTNAFSLLASSAASYTKLLRELSRNTRHMVSRTYKGNCKVSLRKNWKNTHKVDEYLCIISLPNLSNIRNCNTT